MLKIQLQGLMAKCLNVNLFYKKQGKVQWCQYIWPQLYHSLYSLVKHLQQCSVSIHQKLASTLFFLTTKTRIAVSIELLVCRQANVSFHYIFWSKCKALTCSHIVFLDPYRGTPLNYTQIIVSQGQLYLQLHFFFSNLLLSLDYNFFRYLMSP